MTGLATIIWGTVRLVHFKGILDHKLDVHRELIFGMQIHLEEVSLLHDCILHYIIMANLKESQEVV